MQGSKVNQELVQRILSSPQLPTLPVIALKVLELTRRDDVSVPEIANLIMTDPALASKILRTVNSPFYGLTKQVGTISGALVILGLQAAKTLALGFSLLTHLKTVEKGEYGFDQVRFWKQSIYAATASRELARRSGDAPHEEAFLAGLLAPMGVLALHRVMPEEFDALAAQARGDEERMQEVCREKFDLTPPEVAQLLAEKWQLPPLLVRPIALQRTPELAEPEVKPLANAVATGLVIAEVFAAEDPARAIAAARDAVARRYALPTEEIERLLADIGARAKEAAAMLDMPLGRERSYQEILDEAQEALVALSLRSQKRVESIEREVAALQVKALTDPLTRLANRAQFDEFLDEQFRLAYAQERPLALIFIDLDHFKSVNDTYGHPAGDEVLRRVGRVLRSSVRNVDMVARYGGEEFAVVLTGSDTDAAALRAEAIRKCLESETIQFDGRAIRVTLSAGVAGTDGKKLFSQSLQLTNAADRAVYAAKNAGRNCVRMFRPRALAAAAAAPTSTAAETGQA
jgi:two-component system, cell cycle response regulator